MAMAHKLARIVWHLVKFKQPFNPEVFRKEEEHQQKRSSNASTILPPPSASLSFPANDFYRLFLRRHRHCFASIAFLISEPMCSQSDQYVLTLTLRPNCVSDLKMMVT
jgi:hypothetical protein